MVNKTHERPYFRNIFHFTFISFHCADTKFLISNNNF